jgi:squalene synthase HpnC
MTAVAVPSIAELPTREQVLAQAEHENFTVASAILGRRSVRHLMAIYGFARLVDDVGDEAAGDRGALLDLVDLELRRAYTGSDGKPQHPLMLELAVTIRECSLPAGPFERLIAANRMDQVVRRYQTFEQLLGYCQLSAAPVGELVLGVFDAATPARVALSDKVCAGLQIVEHLQDVAEDHQIGRVYLPKEDLIGFGCDEADLAGEPTAALQALVAFEAARARRLLDDGAPLARTLPWRARLAVAGFIAGGRRAIEELTEAGRRPGLAKHMLKAVAGR